MLVILSRQQAVAQRRVGQQRDIQAVAGFVQRVLPAAVEQAVRVLHRGHTWQPMLLRQAHELVHAIGCLVGQAHIAHLARAYQPRQCVELLMNRCLRRLLGRVVVQLAKHWHMAFGPMDLVEIDHVGLQPAQAGLAGAHDVVRCQTLAFADPGHAARWAGHLARQHHALAYARPAGEPAPQNGLGGAIGFCTRRHGVHLGRVEKVHPTLQGAVEDGVGVGLIHLLAKGHGAQTNG